MAQLTLSSCPFISIGTFHASNQELAWRLPLALACVGPLALLVGLPFIPGGSLFMVFSKLITDCIDRKPKISRLDWAECRSLGSHPADP